MHHSVLALTVGLACLALCFASVELDEDESAVVDKRAMRNALVRFGRGGSMRNAIVRLGKRAMRNAIVRFGKRDDDSSPEGAAEEDKRSPPQPFVRFGRSGHSEHVNSILDTLRKLNEANEY
uniref:Uncharacterized protein n=1 Tax=Plectus sambesii TaxID=2011161 RepID=A0A914XC12_9BILA